MARAPGCTKRRIPMPETCRSTAGTHPTAAISSSTGEARASQDHDTRPEQSGLTHRRSAMPIDQIKPSSRAATTAARRLRTPSFA
ncbi:hypothetical protein [Kibdelosporangium philippinense]|uniref:hypothetical protein n=1 Tax=Kibdelosporangium philippinense TaxID=211113 RepID=UPI00362278C7